MISIIKNTTKRILIDTQSQHTGLTDMKLKVINLSNNVVIYDILMTESFNTAVYFADISISAVGKYLFQAYSESASLAPINNIVNVLEYDVIAKIEEESKLSRQLQSNKAVVSSDGLSVIIYADDGVTVLHEFEISADKRTRNPV